MRGSPTELEQRRILAVRRVLEGYTTEEVSEFLDIDARSVRRWRKLFQVRGWRGLAAHPVPGRPPRLSCTQEKIIRRWLSGPATELGFSTELWTAPRLAAVIVEEFGVGFHPDYLGTWLRRRGFSPQRPRRVAREQEPERIAAWRERDWPRIKKKPRSSGQPWP